MATILFHRQYDRYSGGQQKVLDYFEHCIQHPTLAPSIHWGTDSIDLKQTPWNQYRENVVTSPSTTDYDYLFLAGVDWNAYLPKKKSNQTVINLIQHVRHADPESDVYGFLKEPAVRICVSKEVKAAIDATGVVNGETFAIPNGINVDYLDTFKRRQKSGSVYILGFKQQSLALELSEALEKEYTVICHQTHVERNRVLEAMAASEISILLPHQTEGFFLPALEAMRLSKLVIVPDCIGNRSFCQADENCLMPDMTFDSIMNCVLSAEDKISRFPEKAQETVALHTLQRERQTFFDLLSSVLGVS